jgi:uncharacterized OB-fold protein
MQVSGMRCRDCGRPLKPFQQQHCSDCSHTRQTENIRNSGLQQGLSVTSTPGRQDGKKQTAC